MNILNYLLDRLGENSTWRGITLLLASAGIAIDPEHASAFTAFGLSTVGVINLLRKQPKHPKRR